MTTKTLARKLMLGSVGLAIVIALSANSSYAAPKRVIPPHAVGPGADGTLTYAPEPNGDRVPDFSYAGYDSANAPIPDAPIQVVVPTMAGDATGRIQAALDYVASLPLGKDGLRGAVLLQKGTYNIDGSLHIVASGVVLRGQGMGDNGTTLLATGLDRRTIVAIKGQGNRTTQSRAIAIDDKYVPVNASSFTVKDASAFKVGDTVVIRRPCTAEWIKTLKMEELGGGVGSGWKPGSRDLMFDRTVTGVAGNKITIDVPLTNSLDATYGGGTIEKYTWPGRITNVGVENLRLDSAYDTNNLKDEAHSWIAVSMDNTRDAWVRQVIFSHFVSSAVAIFDSCSRVTVEDCKSLAPISEDGGYRRQIFYTIGEQTLFLRCYSEYGRHDFAVGLCSTGPTAFVACQTFESLGNSGPIDSWATGVLFDCVRLDGNAISLKDLRINGQFAGWGAANSVIWQCTSTWIDAYNPPTAHNWCFGNWGAMAGDSSFWDSSSFIHPDSLYYGQLAARRGEQVMDHAYLLPRNDAGESRNPTPEEAAAVLAASLKPAFTISELIDEAPKRTPIPTDPGSAKLVDDVAPAKPPKPEPPKQVVSVKNGWLTVNGLLVVGGHQEISWWRGGTRPLELADNTSNGPNPTRYVPGRAGQGLTNDLDQLAEQMLNSGREALDYHYGLWYDTRSVDHEPTRRINGDVWPPFYELPFKRSGGTSTAWDGLSKYDLMQYNPWYWSRLKQFADICDRTGLILQHDNFFQHNLLEAGAHWASCPWRSANNINDMQFPEPPPYAGDKIIYMAPQFYDVTNVNRRKVFTAYINQCLNNFVGNSNVIQFTSDEFSGPPEFAKFWVETAGAWEKQTGNKAMIGLAAPKNAQDAVLADPALAATVDIIDVRYWWYTAGGGVYAPIGGQNLTPRQWERKGAKGADFESTLRSVKEYRQKFPDKAVMFTPNDKGEGPGWAVLMGGGSMPNLNGLDDEIRRVVPTMQPIDLPGKPAGQFALGDPGKNYLVYSGSTKPVFLDLPAGTDHYTLRWVDPQGGELDSKSSDVTAHGKTEIKPTGNIGGYAFWLSKK